MSACSRCGQCCLFIVLSRVQGATKDTKEYARAHGLIEDQGYFLVPYKCPHLKSTDGSFLNGEPTRFLCDIHDTKPKICKEFDGRRYKNHVLYWVPKGCTMVQKEKTLGERHAGLPNTDKGLVSKTPS